MNAYAGHSELQLPATAEFPDARLCDTTPPLQACQTCISELAAQLRTAEPPAVHSFEAKTCTATACTESNVCRLALQIYMETPLHVCEGRDPKGLYKLAREGKIKNFTGIDDPYEPPPNPEIVLQSQLAAPQEMAGNLLCYLQKHGYLAA